MPRILPSRVFAVVSASFSALPLTLTSRTHSPGFSGTAGLSLCPVDGGEAFPGPDGGHGPLLVTAKASGAGCVTLVLSHLGTPVFEGNS